MEDIIVKKLKDLEKEHDVKILYACESGSRAWGFASADSDFDVRFIYVHRKDHYLSIDEQRDVIELPVNDVLDINGWELRKALRLLRKSNAPLFEWFQSPVVYSADTLFAGEIRQMMSCYFSPRAAMHHYISMAKSVFEGELSGDAVKLKKYFYALRPALACRWVADRAEVPPMEFSKLRLLMKDGLRPTVDHLLKLKAAGDEKTSIERIDELHDLIQAQIVYCSKVVPVATERTIDDEPLNQLFRKYIV